MVMRVSWKKKTTIVNEWYIINEICYHFFMINEVMQLVLLKQIDNAGSLKLYKIKKICLVQHQIS